MLEEGHLLLLKTALITVKPDLTVNLQAVKARLHRAGCKFSALRSMSNVFDIAHLI